MKKALKILGAFALLIIIGWYGFQQYQSWQQIHNDIEAAQAPQGKLPATVNPLHYRLKLRIDPDEKHFSGTVSIDVQIKEKLDHLWLHGKSISAKSASLKTADGEVIPLDYHEMGHSGVVKLSALNMIEAQAATIDIQFDAPFDSKLLGLYTVSEDTADGLSLNYAFTQFEAISARLAFPCFDEPRFKVPFDITLEVQQGHRGFTNTSLLEQRDIDNGFKQLQFATTKALPTYLIAFAVGDFDVIEYSAIPANNIRQREIPLRGIAIKGKGDQLTYALENTAAILNTLESYFGTAYPYQKLDIVAVPDFAAGAMENAGLITYREDLLLFSDTPSVEQQRSYASTHAHELAHQWFGNLVTMPWWDDLWLNESFATWMGNKAVQQWNKDFEFDRELVRHAHAVMNMDIFADSRQIREPVKGNEEIANAFDGITYVKGGAVLQMLESTITPEVFQQAIQYHMQKFAFANATAADLLDSLVAVSKNEQLADIANSFISQPGVPLLELSWRCNDEQLQIELKQSRYLQVGSTLSSDQNWHLPVCLTLLYDSGKPNERVCRTLSETHTNIALTGQCPVAIMPNSDGKAYYRWSPGGKGWQQLLSNIDGLTGAEKFSLAANLSSEFGAGRIDINFYLQSIAEIVRQPEWDLITQPIGMLEYISDYIAEPEEKVLLADYSYALYQPVLNRLEDNKAHEKMGDKLLRKRILGLMALRLHQKGQLQRLATLGKQAIGFGTDEQLHIEEIDPELLYLALASAVQLEGEAYFDHLLSSLKASNNAVFRARALGALGSTTDPELSKKVLDLGLVFSLKLNDIPSLLMSHMGRVENHDAIYAWIKRYYSVLSFMLPEQYLANAPMIAAQFCDVGHYQDAKAFFTPKTKDVAGMTRILSQSLEKIELCSALVAYQKRPIVID